MQFSGCMQINEPDALKCPKPEVEIEIQDGGGGHLEFLKTQYLSQILTDFDAVKNTRLEIFRAISKE